MQKHSHFLLVFCFIFILLSLTWMPINAQVNTVSQSDESFVKWARTNAVSLQNSEPEVGSSDLTPLKAMIGSASVVALGEASHGLHEPLAFRNRIFRYLVENMGFTTIALEANLARSRPIADFIAGGPGTAERLAANLTIADPAIDDIELLNWMRKYNKNPLNKRKIKLYGMDIQLDGFPGDTVPFHPAIDEVMSYLTRIDSASARRTRLSLAPFLERMSVARYPLFSESEQDKINAALDDLAALLEHNRLTFIATGTKDSYEWAYRNAIAARQTHRMIRLFPPETPGKIHAEAWRSVNARDAAMAENVLWMANKGERVFVYAHNGHIQNAPRTGGVWDAFAQLPTSEGQFLRSVLGKKLVIIGLNFPSPHVPAQAGSLETALLKVNKPRFLLDLRKAQAVPQAAEWLSKPRPMQANMMTYMNLSVGEAFDAILYMDKVTPLQRLKLK